jgi:enoyl-CoA hydratase/carnithine racemase
MEDIKLAITDGIATITIDRGDDRNAVRPQTLRELCRAVDEATASPEARVILLTSTGKHFSAGADFAFLESLKTTPGPQIRDEIYSAFQGAARRLWDCPKPTIAAVEGAAITVGCELALVCDFRIAGERASFQEAWVRLGLLPPLGGLFLLPRLIGLGRAAEMALTGRAVAAQEALAIGLVNRLAPSETLQADARAWAIELAGMPPLAYRAIKEGLHRSAESTMEKEWATNVLAQTMLLGSEDFREGLTAVVERRPGRFTGA